MEAGKNGCWHMLHVTALRCIEPDKIKSRVAGLFSLPEALASSALCPLQPCGVVCSNGAAVWSSVAWKQRADSREPASQTEQIAQDCGLY